MIEEWRLIALFLAPLELVDNHNDTFGSTLNPRAIISSFSGQGFSMMTPSTTSQESHHHNTSSSLDGNISEAESIDTSSALSSSSQKGKGGQSTNKSKTSTSATRAQNISSIPKPSFLNHSRVASSQQQDEEDEGEDEDSSENETTVSRTTPEPIPTIPTTSLLHWKQADSVKISGVGVGGGGGSGGPSENRIIQFDHLSQGE